MTREEAQKRVARGAALLDEKRPGWAERVNPLTLMLNDPCGCVVGQLCGSFSYGIVQLFDARNHADYEQELEPHAIRCGFELSADEYEGSADDGVFDAPERIRVFAPLQDAWLDAIADRLVPQAIWTHRESHGSAEAVSAVAGLVE